MVRIACLCGRPPSSGMTDKLEQAQARVKRLEEAIPPLLAEIRSHHMKCGQSWCTAADMMNAAKAALAEGGKNGSHD